MNKFIFYLVFLKLLSQSFLQACEPEKKEKSEIKISGDLKFVLWVPVIDRNTTIEQKIATNQINEFLKNKENLEARNQYGDTPLSIAVSLFHGQALVKHLLDMGADVETKDNFINLITGEIGNTPLSDAIYNRNPKTVKILLEYGAKIDPRYLKYAQRRYEHYGEEPGEEHKAEGFKEIIDLPAFKQLRKLLTIQKETGISKDVIESTILPYDPDII